MKKKFSRQALNTLFFLTALTIVCGFLVRTLTNSETLSDYAARNPELAYGDTDHGGGTEDGAEDAAEPTGHIDAEERESDDVNASIASDNISITESENYVASPGEVQDTDIQTDSTDAISPERTVYQEGFFYEPLSDEIKTKITGISYPASETEAASLAMSSPNTIKSGETPAISYDDLRYLSVLYYDFNGNVQVGELICSKGIVEDLAEIFHELYLNEYQIEKIMLVDEYQGDDEASMRANNTSCFNYRVVPGTDRLSKHALGCAIDINPFYNPYVVGGKDGVDTAISPAGSEAYADRSVDFEHKIDENDLCYRLFTEHGFEWGGNWKTKKDYQHFQKVGE